MAMFGTTGMAMLNEPTNQDKIKYLKRYINLDREIDRKLDEVAHWRGKLEKVTQVLSLEPRGGGSIYGRTEAIITKIVDIEQEIDAEIDELVASEIIEKFWAARPGIYIKIEEVG